MNMTNLESVKDELNSKDINSQSFIDKSAYFKTEEDNYDQSDLGFKSDDVYQGYKSEDYVEDIEEKQKKEELNSDFEIAQTEIKTIKDKINKLEADYSDLTKYISGGRDKLEVEILELEDKIKDLEKNKDKVKQTVLKLDINRELKKINQTDDSEIIFASLNNLKQKRRDLTQADYNLDSISLARKKDLDLGFPPAVFSKSERQKEYNWLNIGVINDLVLLIKKDAEGKFEKESIPVKEYQASQEQEFSRLKKLTNLLVKRSSGEIESGWQISDKSNDMVEVIKKIDDEKFLKKRVYLAELARWNENNFEKPTENKILAGKLKTIINRLKNPNLTAEEKKQIREEFTKLKAEITAKLDPKQK